jgi:hypothetical protein
MTMHHSSTAVGALLTLTLFAGPAAAGPCSQQINELASLLGWQDAGSGPTPGASTISAPQTQPAGHPPTASANKAAEGKATSSDDANRQTTGRSTVGDQAQGARSSAPNDESEARAALQRARTLDAQGSDECKQAVQEARRLTGHIQ